MVGLAALGWVIGEAKLPLLGLPDRRPVARSIGRALDLEAIDAARAAEVPRHIDRHLLVTGGDAGVGRAGGGANGGDLHVVDLEDVGAKISPVGLVDEAELDVGLAGQLVRQVEAPVAGAARPAPFRVRRIGRPDRLPACAAVRTDINLEDILRVGLVIDAELEGHVRGGAEVQDRRAQLAVNLSRGVLRRGLGLVAQSKGAFALGLVGLADGVVEGPAAGRGLVVDDGPAIGLAIAELFARQVVGDGRSRRGEGRRPEGGDGEGHGQEGGDRGEETPKHLVHLCAFLSR